MSQIRQNIPDCSDDPDQIINLFCLAKNLCQRTSTTSEFFTKLNGLFYFANNLEYEFMLLKKLQNVQLYVEV